MSSQARSYADEVAKLWDTELRALYRQLRDVDVKHAEICRSELKRRGISA